MSDEFNEKLYEEKHKNIDKHLGKMRKDIDNIAEIVRDSTDALHKKINWFFLLAIVTLCTVVGNLWSSRNQKPVIVYQYPSQQIEVENQAKLP